MRTTCITCIMHVLQCCANFPCQMSEKGEVLLRGSALYDICIILGENSACQVPKWQPDRLTIHWFLGA